MRKNILLLPVLLTLLMSSNVFAAPYAYIGHHWEGTVSVVDTATNAVTATIPVGPYPIGVAVNPLGTRVYVAKDHTYELAVIDTATNAVTATVSLPYNDPIGVAVNPAGTRVYVSNGWGENISVVDTATNTVIANIPHGANPGGLDVTPDGTKLYVGTAYSDFVAMIDTATNAVVADIPVGNDTTGIVINPSGTKAYVARRGNNTVCVLDIATNIVTATVPVGSGPTGIAINPLGTKVYVTNYNDNTVSVIDTASNTVTATLAAENSPQGIAVTPDGTKVYVTNVGSDAVTVIDIASDTVIGTFTTGAISMNFGKFIGPAIRIVDTTPPVTTAVFAGALGSGTCYASDVQASLTALDNYGGSGVKELLYNLDGVETVLPVVTGSVSAFPIAGEGVHTLSSQAVDNAMNSEPARPPIVFTIDKTPPVVTVSATPDHLWPGDGRMVNVVINGSAQDTLSGISSVVITVTDEYGVYNMTVPGFGSTIQLQARNDSKDPDHQRTYTVTAVAIDCSGNQSSATTYIIVAK